MPAIITHPLVVFKLGGSLLERPNLADFIRQTIARRPDCGALLVVGGGRTADLIRDWDRTHTLGEETAHWLALDAMRLNEALISQLMSELRAVRNARQVASAVADRAPALLCADCFVRWGESTGHPPLPHTWQTTSDSIAAWSADILGADELVLLKSVPAPAHQSLEEASATGVVDPVFPSIARNLRRISWVDGSCEPAVIESWL